MIITNFLSPWTVNVGGYIQAVLDKNLAENISRVLYPNDNVSPLLFSANIKQNIKQKQMD